MKTDLTVTIEHNGSNSTIGAYQVEDQYLLGQDYFHQLISLERKRTERSGNPSLLMLIDLSNFSGHSELVCVVEKINSLLTSLLRETDVRGWYKCDLIGIIMTELGHSDLLESKEKILTKFNEGLETTFGQAQAKKIRVTFEFITKRKKWFKNGNFLLNNGHSTESAPATHKENLVRAVKFVCNHSFSLALTDLFLISLASLASTWIRFGDPINPVRENPAPYALLTLLCLASLYVFDLYHPKKIRSSAQIPFRVTLSVVLALGCSAICFYLVPHYQYGRGILALDAAFVWVLLVGWRFLYNRILHVSKAKIPTLILGSGDIGRSALQILRAPHSRFEVIGFLDEDPERLGYENDGVRIIGTVGKVAEIISQNDIKAVVLAMDGNATSRMARKILETRLSGIEVIDLPALHEELVGRLPLKHVEDQWLVSAEGFNLISKGYVQRIKRIIDFTFAAIMLFLSLPLILTTALLIRIDSPGPIFYKQKRVGKGCKPFTVYKFRSMRCDAEKCGATWAQKRDPRVTRVGKWIRMFRIDELPQIWNVLIGEMSLVGPRPERPEFVKELDLHIPYYCVRHTVNPGITGWAQINYPYGATIEEAFRKLEYDLYYVKNMSILLDLKILAKTVGVVILGEGSR
jgi:sugar transferase (PEP-CTERM system associated)